MLECQPVPRIGEFKLTDSNLKRGHEFEGEQVRIYGKVWRERGNNAIIVSKK